MCVIFDMDGVIFDSENACLKCWKITADKYNLDNIEEVFYKCIGTNNAQTDEIIESAYSEKLGNGISKKFREENSFLFHELYDNGNLPIKPGVVELLDYLKSREMPVGIASSTRKTTVIKELTDAGLIKYFDKIVGGDSVKNSKPNPEIYLLACKEMDVQPSLAYAIEDSYNGIRAAYSAGMHPIMVPDIIAPNDEMKKLSEAIFDDLLEVKKYFMEKY